MIGTGGDTTWGWSLIGIGLIAGVVTAYCGYKWITESDNLVEATALGKNLSELDETLNGVTARTIEIIKKLSMDVEVQKGDYKELLLAAKDGDVEVLQPLMLKVTQLQDSIGDLFLKGYIHSFLTYADLWADPHHLHWLILKNMPDESKGEEHLALLKHLDSDWKLHKARVDIAKRISQLRDGAPIMWPANN